MPMPSDPRLDRRRFLQLSSASAIAAAFGSGRAWADESAALYARLVPERKGLSRDWITSLVKAGHPLDAAIRASKADCDLGRIGMTVGGIACGTVYLAGDGRLFVWDIFNQHHEGVVRQQCQIPEGLENIAGAGAKVRERDGSSYLNPPTPELFPNPFRQHFELAVAGAVRRFQASDWERVEFDGTWPVGTVRYADPGCPLRVTLTAWTPFVPLEVADSSLPVTVMEYLLENPGPAAVEAEVAGILANPCFLHTRKSEPVELQTEVTRANGMTLLHHRGVPARPAEPLREDPPDLAGRLDAGTMVLGLEEHPAVDDGRERLAATVSVPASGAVTVRFLLAWHFPNIHPLPGVGRRRRHYAARFPDAAGVAAMVHQRLADLRGATMTWTRVYYDTTLPRWLMDRAAAATNTLQTQNCYLFEDGRFWAWEGIGCCPGTCGHVWHYAQGPARLFPELERNLRLVTDFAIAQNPDGAIRFRAEAAGTVAIDAQTTYVLRAWREHLCSPDTAFLQRAWPGAKRAAEWLLEFDRKDPDGLDGLLHGEQHNTLDAEWFGKVHALCSLYLAALRAAEEMARLMGEAEFAGRCREVFLMGSEKISSLFNGGYFVQEEDPAHLNAIGVGKGCYIDQVIGQWWANHTGLGRLCDMGQVRSALHSLWRHNFVPDVGPFRRELKRGRFYALPGDAGLVMCTWPQGGLRADFTRHWQYAYFNECMSGFEWQAAAHMIQEGGSIAGDRFEDALEDPADLRSLTLRGLAVARAIHDRYAPARRNPYNEIECSDHYARAAASYSVLLAVCGFHYDGPAGVIGFAPKLQPEDFRAPFTAAEGWGTFRQTRVAGKWSASLRVAHGSLRLTAVQLPWLTDAANASHRGTPVAATASPGTITFEREVIVRAGEELVIG